MNRQFVDTVDTKLQALASFIFISMIVQAFESKYCPLLLNQRQDEYLELFVMIYIWISWFYQKKTILVEKDMLKSHRNEFLASSNLCFILGWLLMSNPVVRPPFIATTWEEMVYWSRYIQNDKRIILL